MAAVNLHPIQRIIVSALLFFFLGLLINIPSGCEAQDTLYSGGTLNSGESLGYGAYKFIMQKDCNLVLYKDSSKKWDSGTAGQGRNCYCHLRSNGQLVIQEPGNDQLLWATYNYGFHGNYVLIVQNNGKVVIYGPVVTTLYNATASTGLRSDDRIRRAQRYLINSS